MKTRFLLLPAAILCGVLLTASAWAERIAESGARKVSLVEVYSSEGCESCPPADQWLARQIENPRLWKTYVPAVFHVGYWDYLGWKDAFARPEFTARQRKYAQTWMSRKVYTPNFVVDGADWPEWWRHDDAPEPPSQTPGWLTIDFNGQWYTGTFREGGMKGGSYFLHTALLGFGVRSDVTDGENKGRVLEHNFLVLDYNRQPMFWSEGVFTRTDIRLHSDVPTKRRAVVMWVSRAEMPKPLQSAGTFLKEPSAVS